MRLMGSAIPAIAMKRSFAAMAQTTGNGIELTLGRFTGTRPSLMAYTIPD